MSYQLHKDKPNVGSVRWYILRDGQRLTSQGELVTQRWQYPAFYTRKRDAMEKIQAFSDWDIYLERLFSQDYARVYIWTADEWKQIQEMAQKLIENEEKWTSHEKVRMLELSREHHWKQCDELRTNRLDLTRNNAITRRVMAARHEAHRLAGVEL